MMKKRRSLNPVHRHFRRTQAYYRLMRLKFYRKRVKAVEKELGDKLNVC